MATKLSKILRSRIVEPEPVCAEVLRCYVQGSGDAVGSGGGGEAPASLCPPGYLPVYVCYEAGFDELSDGEPFCVWMCVIDS